MTEFKILQDAMEKHFKSMVKDSNFLFTLNLEKNELWELYLDSFPEGTNPIYRERREYDCSCCRQFINAFGDTVAIVDKKIVGLWDFEMEDPTYKPVVQALAKHIKSKMIKDVFLSKEKQIGTKSNLEDDEGTIKKWYHFNVTLPNKFVVTSGDSIATQKGMYRDVCHVFKRSLEEISKDAVLTILELINSKSLYKGDEWKGVLNDFHKHQKDYEKLSDEGKQVFLWNMATSVGGVVGKIRNHSIGTLLTNVTEGMELDKAVKKYEAIVAPTNYKRPKPIFTKAMLEKAKKKITDLGYLDSLQRRHAILEDISVNNVLFANRDVVPKLQSDDVFADMEQDVAINPKSFKKVEEVQVEDFVKNILPTTKKIEVYLESGHMSNMVSLVAPYKADAKTMFKWANNFSWAYSGNITDSDIKRNVKSAGGRVDGILRFSIQWNDENEHNRSDYDAHCIEPKRNLIYYGSKLNSRTGGNLDVDITGPRKGVPAVENITWPDKSRMEKGVYKFYVHNYSRRAGDTGFRAEIEFGGQQFKFDYPKELRQGQKVQVAEVTFDGTNFTIVEKLPSQISSREVWNLKTNNFVPVSVMMYSPNYWDEQKGIGHKHYFFMLKDCVNEETPNGFFNEFLNQELNEHRKVFEALGSKMRVETVENQLSGLGFSSTQRNSLIVKIEGQTKRVIKIKF